MQRDSTIKDVARLAQVSIATVSRVINDNYAVSDELKERVQSAIDELNYVPNSIARSLKVDHTLTIGLIVSDISNSFFTVLARSAEDIITKKRYNLIVCSTDDDQEKEANYINLLLEKKVDGIILNTTGKNDALVASISRTIPIALCSRKVNHPDFIGDFVETDNNKGAAMLTRHLLDLGHTRIAVINGQNGVSSSLERYQGFVSAMNNAGIKLPEDNPYHVHANFNKPQSGGEAMKTLFSLPSPPTAVITMNNELAMGAIRYCVKNGINVPEDISICSFGEISNSDLMTIQPSYIIMDPASMGTTLAEMVIDRIASTTKIPNREVRFTTSLVEGSGIKRITQEN